LTSRARSNYKYPQQLEHPRRYAPIRPEQEGAINRNGWARSIGIGGRDHRNTQIATGQEILGNREE
jgi:hypothetical protein